AELERTVTGRDELAAEAGTAVDRRARAQRHPPPDRRTEVRGLAERALEPRRGDLDRVPVEVAAEDVRHALAERVVDPGGMVDVDRHALRPRELDREHLDAGEPGLDRLPHLAKKGSFPVMDAGCHLPFPKRNVRRAPISPTVKCGDRTIASARPRPCPHHAARGSDVEDD